LAEKIIILILFIFIILLSPLYTFITGSIARVNHVEMYCIFSLPQKAPPMGAPALAVFITAPKIADHQAQIMVFASPRIATPPTSVVDRFC